MATRSAKQEKTLSDLFADELKDVYNAEQQLTKALPKMAKAASTPSLQEAIQGHLEETRGQVARLEQIFDELGMPAKGKTCEAMKGLLKEGDEMVAEFPKGAVRDAAIISAAQRVEHYEIAAYGSLRAFAEQLGHENVVSILEETLEEEKSADEKLSEIATGEVNAMAAGSADDDDEDSEEGEDEDESEDEDEDEEESEDEEDAPKQKGRR